MAIRARTLAPALGTEITGVDVSDHLDDEAVRVITDLWDHRGVLVFRGRPMSDEAHVRFARRFGVPGTFRQRKGHDGLVNEIFRAGNLDEAGRLLPADSDQIKLIKLNWSWHIDSSYRRVPTKGTILRGMVVAQAGGDTVFANLAAAYSALPDSMKRRIDGLFARHSFEYLVASYGLPPMNPEDLARLPAVVHPLVRQLADGRRSLYLSPPYMDTIVGWSQAESRALIAELSGWATQDRFTYCHRWAAHDVVMWDNGWTMHKVTPYDLATETRVMHGTTLNGTQSIDPPLEYPVSLDHEQGDH